ncbi:hypothetical protein J6590_065235 [Homalodisca vitripennis]|nr:hypothetical protein J6590_065235 [Homalodisca vitripennis]
MSRSHRVGRFQPRPAPDGPTGTGRRFLIPRNDLRDPITIREDLTARRTEVLRQATARFGARSTWTQDGRVMWVDRQGAQGVATRLADLPVANIGLATPIS